MSETPRVSYGPPGRPVPPPPGIVTLPPPPAPVARSKNPRQTRQESLLEKVRSRRKTRKAAK